MSNTPTEPEMSSLHASLLKSLQLTVNPADPNPVPPSGAPVPDTGVELTSTIDDFSEGSGSLADKMRKIERTVAEAAPATPPVAPTAPVPPAVPATVAAAPVIPPVDPAATPPAEPVRPQMKIPEMPKPFSDDTILPPPPSLLDFSGLDDDELEEVRTAQFAEQHYPERYKGHAEKILNFLKAHRRFLAEHGEDTDTQEYKGFIQSNRPAVTNSERKRLERERMLEEAASLAEKRMASKTKRLEEEVTQLKATPIVEKTINDYKSMVKDLMPKEDDPIVIEAVDRMSSLAENAGREFLLLASSLKPYDTKNETHKWLADFIKDQGELFVKSGHASLKRGSRVFVPRAQYNSLPVDQRDKHFTFTDEDILQLIAVNAKAAAEFHSTNERERLKKAGYTRTVSSSTPPAASTPPPVEPSARATSSVMTGTPVFDNKPTDPFLKFMAR